MISGPIRKHTFGEPEPEKKKRKRTEDHTQAEVVAWLRARGITVVRCENAAKRRFGVLREKALGLQVGAPDLILVGREGATVWVECKTETGRLSDEQKEFHALLRRMGHMVIVGYGSADIIRQFENRHTLP